MKKANRIATWLLAASVILLLASEDHARRVWKARAMEAETTLTNTTFKLMALELAQTKQTESWVAPLVRPIGGQP